MKRFLLAILFLVVAATWTTAQTSKTSTTAKSADAWRDIATPLLDKLKSQGLVTAYPGGCSGVVVNRLNGEVTIKVVGLGLYRSSDQGAAWSKVEGNPITGRDETGWTTNMDAGDPRRMASFSLDGVAGWTTDGKTWRKFAEMGRNWDYGSIDWSAAAPATIIVAKHETTPAGEVYVSSDGGASWKKLDILLGGDRREPAMVGSLGTTTLIYSNGHGIFRSTDSGTTWTLVSPENPLTRIPVYFRTAHYLGTSKGLLVSRDRGATWKSLGSAVSIRQGPFFGANEKNMVVAGDDGVFRTIDGGINWLRVSGLHPDDKGFSFSTNWFGCYAWDPIHNIIYSSTMGHPVYSLKLNPAK